MFIFNWYISISIFNWYISSYFNGYPAQNFAFANEHLNNFLKYSQSPISFPELQL